MPNNKDFYVYRKIKIYDEKFTDYDLKKYENKIFSNNYNEYQKAKMEYDRTVRNLNYRNDLVDKYYNELSDICENIENSKLFDFYLVDAELELLKLQILNGIDIRLYSKIKPLVNKIENENSEIKYYENKKFKNR